ncbi:MAG: hypothetical protein ABIJ56_00960 [Pseudomonadota bacterium]
MGTAFFVWGAYFWDAPTWDVGVSVIMSVLCYLLAPLAVATALHAARKRPKLWPLRLLASAALVYFIASGSYEIYNTLRMGFHPVTYWENLQFSIPVTIAAGLLWQYDGSLADLLRLVRGAITNKRG